MANPLDRSLSDWIRIVERRKSESLRSKLGIPSHLRIEGILLEALAYHLTERNGSVSIKFEGETLRVGEPNKKSGGIPYRGAAVGFLLRAWNLSREEAEEGVMISVKNGVRRQ